MGKKNNLDYDSIKENNHRYTAKVVIKFEVEEEDNSSEAYVLLMESNDTKNTNKYFYDLIGKNKDLDYEKLQKIEDIEKYMNDIMSDELENCFSLKRNRDFLLNRIKSNFRFSIPQYRGTEQVYEHVFIYQFFPLTFNHLPKKHLVSEQNNNALSLSFYEELYRLKEQNDGPGIGNLLLVKEKDLVEMPPFISNYSKNKNEDKFGEEMIKTLPIFCGERYEIYKKKIKGDKSKKIKRTEKESENNDGKAYKIYGNGEKQNIVINDLLPIIVQTSNINKLPFSLSIIQQKLAMEGYFIPSNSYQLLKQIENAYKDPLQRPIFIIGPPGCGKTTIAKTLHNMWIENLTKEEKENILLSTKKFVEEYMKADQKLYNEVGNDIEKLKEKHSTNEHWKGIFNYDRNTALEEHFEEYKENSFRTRLLAGLSGKMFSDTLFGYRYRTYTSATYPHIGEFSFGYAGTVFLDEITTIDMETQSQLLQCFSFSLGVGFNKVCYRVREDSTNTESYFRLICATNSIPNKDGGFDGFRKDLLSRLSENTINFFEAYKVISWELILLFSNGFFKDFLINIHSLIDNQGEIKKISLSGKQKAIIKNITKVFITHETAVYISKLKLKETFRNLVSLLISAFFNAVKDMYKENQSKELEIKIKNIPDVKDMFLTTGE